MQDNKGNKMLVYLDASNHFDAMKGRLDLDRLRNHPDIAVVFSAAHFNDAGGGGTQGFAELASYILSWSNALFSAEPYRIPVLEFREFVRAHPGLPSQPPNVVFETKEEMGALLDELDGPPVLAISTVEELAAQLNENETLKRDMARASTIAKKAAASKPTLQATPSSEDGARIIIAQMSLLDDGLKAKIQEFIDLEDTDLTIPAYTEPEQVDLQREMTRLLRGLQRAALAGDVSALARILEEQQTLLPRIADDPLLGPVVLAKPLESGRWTTFQTGCVANAGSVLSGLGPKDIAEFYDAMVKHPELCPAWTLLWKIEARMKRDAQTPTKPSDAVDLAHLMVLPYVDVLFADSRIHAYVTQHNDVSAGDKAKCRRTTEASAWVEEHCSEG